MLTAKSKKGTRTVRIKSTELSKEDAQFYRQEMQRRKADSEKEKWRTWTLTRRLTGKPTGGQFIPTRDVTSTLEAKFISCKNGKVKLQDSNKKTLTLLLEYFSAEDRAWIESQMAEKVLPAKKKE